MGGANLLGRLLGSMFAAAVVTLIVGAIISAICKKKRLADMLPDRPGKTRVFWREDFCPAAATASFFKYVLCAVLLLIYIFVIFSPNILLNIFTNVIIAVEWWVFVYLSEYSVIKKIRHEAPSNVRFALLVGKKCPELWDLLKSLNAELTDKMISEYSPPESD